MSKWLCRVMAYMGRLGAGRLWTCPKCSRREFSHQRELTRSIDRRLVAEIEEMRLQKRRETAQV